MKRIDNLKRKVRVPVKGGNVMSNKMITYVFYILTIAVILIGIVLSINGSLEMFPTDEQQGKVRIAGMVLVGLGFVGGVTAMIFKSRKKSGI